MDGLDGMKQWRCKNGHVLGIVQRVKVSERWTTRLMLFRQAIDLEAARNFDDVEVIANIEGTTLDVRCSVCNAVRSWYIGEAALERLIERITKVRGNNEPPG